MLYSIQYFVFTIHKALQEGAQQGRQAVSPTCCSISPNDGNALFLRIPRESFGAAQELLRGPWTCCGSPDAEGLYTPSQGHQCSQPRVKLENKKVGLNGPVFLHFLTNSTASLKNIYIDQHILPGEERGCNPTLSFMTTTFYC